MAYCLWKEIRYSYYMCTVCYFWCQMGVLWKFMFLIGWMVPSFAGKGCIISFSIVLAARHRECIQVTYWLPRWPFLHVHSRGHTCCLNFHACFLSTSGYSSFVIIFFSKKGVYRINMFLLSCSDSYSINFFSRGWGDHYVRSLRFFFLAKKSREHLSNI